MFSAQIYGVFMRDAEWGVCSISLQVLGEGFLHWRQPKATRTCCEGSLSGTRFPSPTAIKPAHFPFFSQFLATSLLRVGEEKKEIKRN